MNLRLTGTDLIAIRKKLKLNQSQLALQLGVSQPTVSRIERRKYDTMPQEICERVNAFLQDVSITNPDQRSTSMLSSLTPFVERIKPIVESIKATLAFVTNVNEILRMSWGGVRLFFPESDLPPDVRNDETLKPILSSKFHVEFLFRENVDHPDDLEATANRLEIIQTICDSSIEKLHAMNDEKHDFLVIKFMHNKGLALHLTNDPQRFDSAVKLFEAVVDHPSASARDRAFALNELSIISLKRHDIANKSEGIQFLQQSREYADEGANLFLGNRGIFETLMDIAERYARIPDEVGVAERLAMASGYGKSLDAESRQDLSQKDFRKRTWPSLCSMKGVLKSLIPWLVASVVIALVMLQGATCQAGSNVNTRTVDRAELMK